MLQYSTDALVTVDQFREVLQRSTLGERRPIQDTECLRGMMEHSNLVATCWDEAQLIGIARSVTDFHYCCYLSDLAVDTRYQRQGIGQRLIDLTQSKLGPRCTIILLAAPAAVEYYPKIGFTHHPHAWLLPREKRV